MDSPVLPPAIELIPDTMTGSRESRAMPFFEEPGGEPPAEGLLGPGLMKLGKSLMELLLVSGGELPAKFSILFLNSFKT